MKRPLRCIESNLQPQMTVGNVDASSVGGVSVGLDIESRSYRCKEVLMETGANMLPL